MRSSEQIDQLAAALVGAQAEFESVAKTDDNPFFKSKYAGLPSVVKAAAPILKKHGLAVIQPMGFADGFDLLTTRVLHESGQWIEDTARLHLAKNTPQAHGSATTYGRRYGYTAMLGLVAEETDDGNAARSGGNRDASAGRSPSSQRGEGGGGSRRSSPSPAAPPSRSSNNERDRYAWASGATQPDHDPSARKATPPQVKRLFAIAGNVDVAVDDALASLWGSEQDVNGLDWKQYKYLTEALEDGWKPDVAMVDGVPWDLPLTEQFAYDEEPF